MEALLPAGEALAAAGASAGAPPACMRDRSAPGTRLELRTVALLRPRHEPLSHSLCRSRSQAGKGSALEVASTPLAPVRHSLLPRRRILEGGVIFAWGRRECRE